MFDVALTINGVALSGHPGQTILEVARENNIDIPTLCYLKDFPPIGACRLCIVEVEGSRTLVGSCHTPITEGMVIQTHSPRVIAARRILIELLLASHPDSCIICDKANTCELRKIAADLDVGMPRFRIRKHYYPVEDENPYIIRDMSKCIMCRRCVTACRAIEGRNLFSVAYRGFDSKVVYGLDQPLGSEESCRDCDVCISLCPTGALIKPVKIGEGKQGTALFLRG
jgi:NADH dehydrogenase/NADH:ubiquinone oxidoreductase subunit G